MERRRIAWILTGGWDGHQPERMAEVLGHILRQDGFEVQVVRDLSWLADMAALRSVDLVVPNWTNGRIESGWLENWLQAVADGGTGVAGVHGGMADAFRSEPRYHEMVGGQWVAHPGGDGVTYMVHIVDPAHPLTAGLTDFEVTSEQYYLHIDPALSILATTRFDGVTMPVAWTKSYGRGRVFYCALGHTPNLIQRPPIRTLVARGLTWAARGVAEGAP
jgi:type 1 glutamine amidotransferase